MQKADAPEGRAPHGVRAPGAADTAAGYKHNSAQATITATASIVAATARHNQPQA